MTHDLLSALWTAQRLPELSPRDWERLLVQARTSRLAARLALHLRDQGWQELVPPRAWLQLENALRTSRLLQRDVGQELRHLARALKGVDTPVVLLKGAAYLAGRLPAARGRLFSDIDILVRQDRLREVESALFAGGWIPEKLKPYDDRYYRQWMHELPPMQHVQRRTYLDVHHTLAPPTSRFVIDGAGMLARAQPVDAGAGDATAMRILAPTDLVLHSALHLMQEGEFQAGLRDLLDIRDLLLHFGSRDDGFWQALLARAAELGLERVLAQVLSHQRRLFALEAPASVRSALRLRGSAVLVHALLSLALAPPAADGDQLPTRLARQLLYIRSHWLRMPWYQILPHLLRKAWARAADRPAAP